MKKRVLSLLMALTLCLTTLPTAVFADVTENGEGSGGTHYVAESGGTQYETVQDILDNMEEEITLLDSVTEGLTVYAPTTIHMNGHSITGNIDATDSLTLNGGTVDGTVKVDGGTLNMTAPAEAEAAITGGLSVVSGSASVSGAKVGVKGTLYFDGTDMLISGAVKAVELDSAAKPAAKTLYGSATVNGDTAAEAGFDTDTYKVGGEIAKKLTSKQVGSTTPGSAEPDADRNEQEPYRGQDRRVHCQLYRHGHAERLCSGQRGQWLLYHQPEEQRRRHLYRLRQDR